MEAVYERELEAHRAIGPASAFAIQFRLLWQSRRPLVLAVGMLAVLALSGPPWVVDEPIPRLFTLWGVWVAVVGPVWAFAVFYNEGPSQRLYHWSQPVPRHVHTMVRIAAGASWLMVIFVCLVLAGIAFGLMDGNVGRLGDVGPAAWVNLFTAPLLGYLAVSVLSIVSDYPIRWFLGMAFLLPVTLSMLDRWVDLDGPVMKTLLKPLASESWGFLMTMLGGIGHEIDQLKRAVQGSGGGFNVPGFDLTAWWIATPIWLAFWAGTAWLAASRHPDTLPRLRRGG